MARKNSYSKSKVCEHGLSDDLIITSSTVITNHKYSEIHRMIAYYCPRHGCYGNYSTTEAIPPEQRRSMAGVPGGKS